MPLNSDPQKQHWPPPLTVVAAPGLALSHEAKVHGGANGLPVKCQVHAAHGEQGALQAGGGGGVREWAGIAGMTWFMPHMGNSGPCGGQAQVGQNAQQEAHPLCNRSLAAHCRAHVLWTRTAARLARRRRNGQHSQNGIQASAPTLGMVITAST